MVFQVLNRLKWKGGLEKCEIIILHRGAPGDRKTIYGSHVTEIRRSYFSYKNGREITIPLHRILEVRLEEKMIWKRKEKPQKQN
ncbi:MAG: RNA repair domain-containing protein [Candidatus Aenigmarchaeota archaeon]|nr:RNA repair domain-containing protein [Candidatus Aenigmarchaeota archaeon]